MSFNLDLKMLMSPPGDSEVKRHIQMYILLVRLKESGEIHPACAYCSLVWSLSIHWLEGMMPSRCFQSSPARSLAGQLGPHPRSGCPQPDGLSQPSFSHAHRSWACGLASCRRQGRAGSPADPSVLGFALLGLIGLPGLSMRGILFTWKGFGDPEPPSQASLCSSSSLSFFCWCCEYPDARTGLLLGTGPPNCCAIPVTTAFLAFAIY